ncbi:hypothetical protein HanRHA438_Chr06g0278111 [Helianthus annuus]|nr:hypothetical protein HanRHA438_Chr06g0278111 [Helianthus annuus]
MTQAKQNTKLYNIQHSVQVKNKRHMNQTYRSLKCLPKEVLMPAKHPVDGIFDICQGANSTTQCSMNARGKKQRSLNLRYLAIAIVH